MVYDQAQSPRLGQRVPVESTYVQMVDTTELIEAAYPGQLIFLKSTSTLLIWDEDAGTWTDVAGGVPGHLTFVGPEKPPGDPVTGSPFTQGDTWFDDDDGYPQSVWTVENSVWDWYPVDPNLPPGYDHIPADNITGGSFVNRLLIGTKLSTSATDTGPRTELSTDGLRIYGPNDPDDTTTLSPGQSVFKGQAEVSNLTSKGTTDPNTGTVSGGVTMRSPGNQVTRGAKLTLALGVTPPGQGPTPTVDWATVPLTGFDWTTGPYMPLDMVWDAASSRWWVSAASTGVSSRFAKLLAFRADGTYDTQLGTNFSFGANNGMSAGARVGTTNYWLYSPTFGTYQVTSSAGTIDLTPLSGSGQMSMAVDGTNLVVAQFYTSGAIPKVRLFRFATAAAASANLVTNGSFESNILGWTATNCGISRDITTPLSGSGSLHIIYGTTADPSVNTSDITITEKTRYNLTLKMRTAPDMFNSYLTWGVIWKTSAGVELDRSLVYQSLGVYAGGTSSVNINWTSPAGATRAQVTLQPSNTNTSYLVDDVSLISASGLNSIPYNAATDDLTMSSGTVNAINAYYIGNGDFGAKQHVVAGDKVYVAPDSTHTEVTTNSFPLPVALTPRGIGYDGSNFWTLGSDKVLYKHESGNKFTTESPNWWVASTYQDTVNGYETPISPIVGFTMKNRARLNVNTTPILVTGVGDPNASGIYLARQTGTPTATQMHANGSTGVLGSATPNTRVITAANFATGPPPVATIGFTTANPAELLSEATLTGSPTIQFWGDGHGRIGQASWDVAGNWTGISSGTSGGPADTYSAFSTSSIDLSTTDTDIPGMSVSITVADTTDRFLVVAAVDARAGSSPNNGVMSGKLLVDGAIQAGVATFNTGSAPATRSTVFQSWVITGMAAGSHTVKMQASMNTATANAITVGLTHTRMTVVKLTAIKGDKGDTGTAMSREFNFASAATTWTINHNLNTKLVEVSCFDSTGVFEYDPEIEYTNLNTITVRWYFATSGFARVVG